MPEAYQWDFDRPTKWYDGFETFSVGIYQWLPKSSGRGLKKSKTIRVNGYVADRQRVYDKAAELCRRLNDARARIDDPPKWLQKSYSVPKPPGLIIGRTSDDLTGARVRAVRQRVMNERLIPAGFVKGDAGTYVRRRGEQIHLIDFQPAKWGHEFTVNLAFHFTFIPPIFAATRVPLAALTEVECAARARIGHFLPGDRDTWFPYGTDADALAITLTSCANVAMAVLDKHERLWADPAAFLADMTAKRGPAWHFFADDVVIAALLMRIGKLDEARQRLQTEGAKRLEALHAAMAAQLETLAARSSTPMIDWFE